MSAHEALNNGSVDEALKKLYEEVRSEPSEPRHRIFLFQLLCVAGDWERALTQLNVAREIDPAASVMAQAYQEILQCEAFRRQVFDGLRTPLVFGDPLPWVAQLIEAFRLDSQGEAQSALDLRQQALEAAHSISGKITVRSSKGGTSDGGESREESAFKWLADGDTRIGPMIEMIVGGRYYWAPLERIEQITIQPPADLRDLVWTPAEFRWANSGEAVGVIPTRYAGSESSNDDSIRLARSTVWHETAEGSFAGLGQRVFVTDAEEYGLMDVRQITFEHEADGNKSAATSETSATDSNE